MMDDKRRGQLEEITGWGAYADLDYETLAKGVLELLADNDALTAELADRDAEAQNLRAELKRLQERVGRVRGRIPHVAQDSRVP